MILSKNHLNQIITTTDLGAYKLHYLKYNTLVISFWISVKLRCDVKS